MNLPKLIAAVPWRWYALALLVVALDLLSKHWVSGRFLLYERANVLPMFDLTLRHNYGAAFSMFADGSGWQVWFLGALAAVVSVGIAVWIARLPRGRVWEAAGLALVLGGALGNLYDRVTLGYVVDFILVYYRDYQFPAFNVADSAITVGAGVLILDAFFPGGKAADKPGAQKSA